jgi:hypothetical protein
MKNQKSNISDDFDIHKFIYIKYIEVTGKILYRYTLSHIIYQV